MRNFAWFLVLSSLSLTSQIGQAADRFPTSPDPRLTPGSLCDSPSAHRYPEHIPYCNRSVGSDLKRTVIQTYDSTLDYEIGRMNRAEFKIDHYIPLCMGGSNDPDNLWPQHMSVYKYTDQLEQTSCEKMAKGKLRQSEAIEIIKRAKADLKEAQNLFQYVEKL